MGKEYIWFKSMKSGYEHCVEVIDNDILNELKNVINRKNSGKYWWGNFVRIL